MPRQAGVEQTLFPQVSGQEQPPQETLRVVLQLSGAVT